MLTQTLSSSGAWCCRNKSIPACRERGRGGGGGGGGRGGGKEGGRGGENIPTAPLHVKRPIYVTDRCASMPSKHTLPTLTPWSYYRTHPANSRKMPHSPSDEKVCACMCMCVWREV